LPTHHSITSFFGPPKAKAGTEAGKAAPVMSKFDKDAWVAKLSDEQKELLKLEIDTLHESWLAVLREDIVKPDFLELKRFIKREIDGGKTVFPPLQDVYSWYVSASLSRVELEGD
jgi:uracil-DNA glycosylase